jgi:hypothetical protein
LHVQPFQTLFFWLNKNKGLLRGQSNARLLGVVFVGENVVGLLGLLIVVFDEAYEAVLVYAVYE